VPDAYAFAVTRIGTDLPFSVVGRFINESLLWPFFNDDAIGLLFLIYEFWKLVKKALNFGPLLFELLFIQRIINTT
jgi:hypothetical protein